MKPRSLRTRLALWHAGLLAATLIILSVLTLLLLRSFLSSRADAALEDYADKTARTIASSLYRASLSGSGERPRFLNKELQEWGRQIQVVEARNGTVVEWSDGLASRRLPVSLTARVLGQKGLTTFETYTDLGEHPVRIVTVPVQMGKEVPYLVQSATSLEGIEDALRRASLILLVLTPSVFVLSLLGGRQLVGRSLKTVDEMTRTALALQSPHSLDKRIQPPGTDDEIARLASAFNEMIARLDYSFRQMQRFTADASHELKTPLTAIRGEAEVALMSELTPEEYRRVLCSIIDEVERMSSIVENLLVMARADADQISLQQEPIAMEEELMSIYEQVEGRARRKGISLKIGRLEGFLVNGDRFWIGQILQNLLSNALKYTPEGGTITLNCYRQDAYGCISVQDTGPGIPAEHLPHIFDRFYRVDFGRSRGAGGAGLGLNIAQWAAQAHGGRIEVNSEVGQGSTFTLWLPIAVPAATEAA
jgi:heavy metal sensor kinase